MNIENNDTKKIKTNNENKHLLNFLKDQGCIIVSKDEILDSEKRLMFIVSSNINILELTEITKDLNKRRRKPDYIFLPKKFKNFVFENKYDKIYYPINITEFKNIKTINKEKETVFKDATLQVDNFLLNTTNDQKIYLTEIESKIVKILFVKKSIKINEIKENILNVNSDINTKALESHLSRIRKKIRNIKLDVEILSSEKNFIKII